jgi:hypothetical protein
MELEGIRQAVLELLPQMPEQYRERFKRFVETGEADDTFFELMLHDPVLVEFVEKASRIIGQGLHQEFRRVLDSGEITIFFK